MSKVAILTDSSAYLPKSFCEELEIGVVPLSVNFEGNTYLDGVDISATDLYTRLLTANTIPTTSQATVQQFVDAFRELRKQGKEIFYMGISSGISGTMESAYQAVKEFPGEPIEVMDTRLVSMALSFMVLTVARAAKAGATLAECKALAEATYPKIGVYFTVDTLTYLHKGGRINSAKRLLGSALNLKPLMEIREGKIELVESVISRKKAIARMLQLVEKQVGDVKPVRISVFHALCEGEALTLKTTAEELLHPVESILSEVSPVVGSHTGPGTLSIAFMAG